MFSPDVGHGGVGSSNNGIGNNSRPLDRAATLRGGNSNPRRRQRTSSADSLNVRQTNPKRRKRSALADNTFIAPEDDDHDDNDNGTTQRRNRHANAGRAGSEHTNGYAREEAPRQQKGSNGLLATAGAGSAGADAQFDAGNLAVRNKAGRKEKRNRGGVEDGTELTKTDVYVMTRDRGIPSDLQDILGSEPWHARLCPDLGFAVALTHTKAIVWRYGHSRIAGHDSGIHVVQLPQHSGSGYDNLPVGTLVHDAGAGELALLVLMPGGKIAYYESVRSAADDGEKIGTQPFEVLTGSISGAFSSEHVNHIVEAESDGFLLATNMGRLFHLSVRDLQGRPSITTQFLRMPSHEKVGIFGSIRNAITGGGYQDVASIITLPGRNRSSKHALVATRKGDVQLWSIARHGAKSVEQEWDLRETIEAACNGVARNLGQHPPVLIDLALTPTIQQERKEEHGVIALVSFPEASSARYFLIGLALRAGSAEMDHVHQIHSYDGPETTPDLAGRKTRPVLLIPEPSHTAFVIFDTKLLIVSLSKLEDTPDSQLHAEAHDLAENYEECLYFNRKLPYHSAGCAAQSDDDRTDRSICNILIHGFGHVKLAATAVPADERKAERRANLIKSRLEQVVFYGAAGDNFLNFRDEELWKNITPEDIEAATTKIIESILDSTSSHIPTLMPSMDQQLKLRSQAIFDLNRFVQRWSLSAVECWRLLWAGEKLAAAREIFSLYNQELAVRTSSKQTILLEELIDMIHENDRHANEPDRGESDCVRHYLIWDIARLSTLVGWAQQSIDQLVQEGVQTVEDMAPLVVQAADILITALESAWMFREDHAATFGLGREVIENGVYQRTYADMPAEPWTATEIICTRIRHLVKITKDMALQLDQIDTTDMPFDDELIGKLASQAAKLTDCAFRSWEEHCRWVESSTNETVHARQKDWRKMYKATRLELLGALVDMGSHIPAADLAEKYLDMDALALVTSKIQEQGDAWSQQPDPEDREQGENILSEVRERTDKYFDLYGRSWAHAYFNRQVDIQASARMLALLPHRQTFLTEFLRSKKEDDKRYNRLAWMNEIRGEDNFGEAAKDLWLTERSETRLWAKQIGLALTKLCKLAALEKGEIEAAEAQRDIRGCTQRIKFTEVQQRLYEYVCPLLHRAIDDEAELQLAMASFGAYVQGKPTLEENLRTIMHQLVRRRVIGIEELIEILTIMSASDQLADEERFADERFYWALWLLHSSGLEVNFPDRALLHERLIWRRVILQDDWVALNRTEAKSDEAVMDEIRSTALYKTLNAGFEDGLLDKHRPLDPRSLHPAGESGGQLRDLGLYPKQDDAYLARLAQDLGAEDAALDEIISKGRLEMWWKGIVEAARADVRGERDAHAKLRSFREAERKTIIEYSRQLQSDSQSEYEEGSGSRSGMALDGAADTDAEVEVEVENQATDVVGQNGNGKPHTNGYHKNQRNGHTSNGSGPSAQIVQETKEAAAAGASPTKKSATSRKKASSLSKVTKEKKEKSREVEAVEGDVVMAS